MLKCVSAQALGTAFPSLCNTFCTSALVSADGARQGEDQDGGIQGM